MNKKRVISVIIILIIIGALIGNSIYNSIEEKRYYQELYAEAVNFYERNQYIDAKNKLVQLPENYENREIMLDDLNNLSDIYSEALKLLGAENFDEGITMLNELPQDYRDTRTLKENIWKLEILTSSKWGDIENNTSNSSWIYLVDFSINEISDELVLYIYEDEYSQTTVGDILMNEYSDKLDLIELLNTDKCFVDSDERDSFTINISTIEEGYYMVETSYFSVTYVKQ